MLPYVMLRITTCSDCPGCSNQKGRGLTTDYFCCYIKKGAAARLLISRDISLSMYKEGIEIPDWCPIALSKNG